MNCPTYTKLYKEYINSPGFQSEISPYKETFDYISHHSGLNVTSFQEIYNLYFGFSTEEEWGFTLPEWTKAVWPKTIIELAIKQYYAETATKELASMVNGMYYKFSWTCGKVFFIWGRFFAITFFTCPISIVCLAFFAVVDEQNPRASQNTVVITLPSDC